MHELRLRENTDQMSSLTLWKKEVLAFPDFPKICILEALRSPDSGHNCEPATESSDLSNLLISFPLWFVAVRIVLPGR